mgnify:FL=1
MKKIKIIGLGIVITTLALISCAGGFDLLSDDHGFQYEGVRWENELLPLNITCIGSTSDYDAECGAVWDAAGTINSRLGFAAFREFSTAQNRDPYRVIVTTGLPIDSPNSAVQHSNGVDGTRERSEIEMHNGAYSTLRWRDGYFHDCHIGISTIPHSELMFLVAQHELGHCLNLADDFTRASIMNWRLTPTRWGVFAWPPRILDGDRDRLRALYLND